MPINLSYNRTGSKHWLIAATIGAIGLFYFIYLPVSYDFDGTVFSSYLRYALIRDNLSEVVQPHHPLYFPLNYGLYKALNAVSGYRVLEYFHLQLFSLFFGMLTLWMSYKLAAAADPEFSKQRFFPFAGLVLLAFSYGIWYYAVEAEVHIAGLFFIACGFYLLFYKPGTAGTVGRTLAAAFCFAAAAGFHLANGLIVFSLLLIFLLERVSLIRMIRFFSFYFMFIVGGLVTLGLFSRTNLLNHYINQLVGKDPMAGYKIDYWSGNFSLRSLGESLESVTQGLLVPGPPLFSFLSILLFLSMAAVIIAALFKSKEKRNYYRMGAWMLPYFIFFSFWNHRNVEFKLNVVLPFLILFIVSAAFFLRRFSGKKRFIFALFPAVVILTMSLMNYYYFLLPSNDLSNNRNYLVAEEVGRKTPANALILVGGCGSDLSLHNKIYLSYFAFRRTFILDWMLGKGLSLEDIHTRVKQEQSKGTPVYLFSEIVRDSETSRQLLKNHQLKAGDYFNFIHRLTGPLLGQEQKKIPLQGDYYLLKIL
jgi:hypothetical protein